MADPFDFCDALGPMKVIHVHEPRLDLKAILVIDNVACGPSIGGLRMATDVSLEECFRLARAMTLKNAAAGLPHGGGKSVMIGDPKMPMAEKEKLVRAFAKMLKGETDYIFGPDMGTNEECMAYVVDEIGRRAVGLPPEIGGIPLDVIGATGYGLFHAIDIAKDFCGMTLDGARVVVQGFGSVGKHAARFLAEKGTVLVAACDSQATVFDPNGLDVADLIAFKDSGASFNEYGKAKVMDRDAVIDVDCDIWIPAARPDVLTADNVKRLKTRMVAQGANIPATREAEEYMHANGILVIPDFIANAGGVICGAVEYAGGSESDAFAVIETKIRANTAEVLKRAKVSGSQPRDAAVSMARERVE
ncbi:MAG: Glu/Leu/Phe/Val dehydrogenase, partial [Rhodospirillales bacterium]|nr:Glu/Leu/Phe/Val dehydrogenase [Rhodospirillales bacterium]